MNIASEGLFTQSCGRQDEINAKFVGPATSDEVLVAAAKLGNHPAFAELWRRYSNTALKIVYRVTGNRDDAEDAIQDAWMKAYLHLKTFDSRSKFSTWFTRIAINSALMILRKKRSHPETSMDWSDDGETWQQWEVGDKRANIEERYAKEEAEKDLHRAIHRLRPALRTIIEIQQSHDGSVKEIAGVAGISVAAAKSRLLRARTVLRRSLQSSVRSSTHNPVRTTRNSRDVEGNKRNMRQLGATLQIDRMKTAGFTNHRSSVQVVNVPDWAASRTA
jgi:RNA polymerase sigma factor (sigma-70 family)